MAKTVPLVSDYANIAVFAPISDTNRRYPLYVPLEKTKSTGLVLWEYVETVPGDFLKELQKRVVVIFQKENI